MRAHNVLTDIKTRNCTSEGGDGDCSRRVQKDCRMLEKGQDVVAKERDVKVGGEGDGVEGITENAGSDTVAEKEWQEEELGDLQQHKERESAVAVDVDRIQPLDSLAGRVIARRGQEVGVGDMPAERGGDDADKSKIHNNSENSRAQRRQGCRVEGDTVPYGCSSHKDGHYRDESRVCRRRVLESAFCANQNRKRKHVPSRAHWFFVCLWYFVVL